MLRTPPNAITALPGILVGHASDYAAWTGCTVVLCEAGAVVGVDVRGPAPGTRETDLLRPEAMIEQVHAICLSGGSAYGLAAADGDQSVRAISADTSRQPRREREIVRRPGVDRLA